MSATRPTPVQPALPPEILRLVEALARVREERDYRASHPSPSTADPDAALRPLRPIL